MSNYNGQFQDSGANTLLATPHSYANIEGSTASQAYVKGQMLVYNNRLCQVIAPISSGNTLTIGTNIAYKNVGDIGKQLVATDGKGFYFDVLDGKYGFYPSASKVASEFVPFGGSWGAVGDYCNLWGGNSGNMLNTYMQPTTGACIILVNTKGAKHLVRPNTNWQLSALYAFTDSSLTTVVNLVTSQGAWLADYNISGYGYVSITDLAGYNDKQWKITY